MRWVGVTIWGIVLVCILLPVSFAATVEDSVLKILEEKGEARVIVKLKGGSFTPIPQSMGIPRTGEVSVSKPDLTVLVARTGFKRERDIPGLGAMAGTIQKDGLKGLTENPLVEGVYEDKVYHPLLADTSPLINAPDVHDLGYTGRGQTVCLLDSGINYTHPKLGGCSNAQFSAGKCRKVIGGYNFFDENELPFDDFDHGTLVAGIIAAEPFEFGGKTHKGIAPDAKLLSLKVCGLSGDGNAECFTSDIISGLEWCIRNMTKFNVSVISMSLGGAVYGDRETCKANDAFIAGYVDDAVSKGIIVVAASGNYGCGNSGCTDSIASPACLGNVTSVGSVSHDGTQISDFSDRAGFLDVVAPGESIVSTSMDGDGGIASGTSVAAPFVTGIALLVKEANPEIRAMDFKKALNRTGTLVFDSGSGLSFPLVNANRTLFNATLRKNITLDKGWSFVSFPLMLPPQVEIAPFRGVEGLIQEILLYNSTTSLWGHLAMNGTGNSSHQAFPMGESVWVKASKNINLTLEGWRYPSTSIVPTAKGWNPFPYFSLANLSVNATMLSLPFKALYGFEKGTPVSFIPGRNNSENNLRTFTFGRGYWLLGNRSLDITLY